MIDVSVIVCSYNDARFISTALESVCRQTASRDTYEVIVVDDGSTDDTSARVALFGERMQVVSLVNARNEGLIASCNRALAAARGRYLTRLDADDVMAPGFVEHMRRPLDADATDLAYCDRDEHELEGGASRRVTFKTFDVFGLIAIGTMMRTELVRAVGGYRDLFWEEYDLYLRYLLRSGRPPVRVPDALVTYTRRGDSMTADRDRVRRGWDELRQAWPPATLERFGRVPDVESLEGRCSAR